ncbi:MULTISPECIES: bifunctional riboflavin kinase/FAD synthetase [unclassified Nitratiruptor]|uniref:bifunctional riboflavin kinase/FAD synthetase n=1 Tax=unclassified Nitratiruptor TaxID=2624044 RepID=UPI0019389026|nr:MULTISPECIES: bifunctional riboflavin kinase/FAD synthetase [unclassified Nitratiruptor]BCD60146.1 riboflavin kinase / FMN adenylyltransferase [Nitratiruptor sp. YY08-10]BCD64365.1 riboflavin kinase / FMN adenylyltransferase [Nitratiruptor sp. YY08-14]
MSGSIFSKRIDSVAIGAFDGMHRGHQALFRKLTSNGAVVVIDKGYALLTPGYERCIHTLYPCSFFPLQEIKDLDAKGFLDLLQKRFPALQRVVVGYDFAFGKDRKYGIGDLQELFKGEVVVVDEVQIDGISVHSRTIKKLLTQGDIYLANKMLGRSYSIAGKVQKGLGLGKRELVPTINLTVENFLLPKEGVYATWSEVGGEIFPSVTFIGKRESVDGSFSIETHIIDKKIEYSIEAVRIYFVQFLRDNKKFNSLLQLKEQIQKDIQMAKEVICG